MFHLELIHLYTAALVISAFGVTAKAWFDYKSVRYQEDTKRQEFRERQPAQLEASTIDDLEPEEE